MRWKRKTKTRTYRITKTYNSVNAVFNSRKPPGIVLILFLCKYLKEKCWNETDRKEKQEHGNTKTYNLANAVLLSRKSSGIVLIWLSYKYLKEKKLE